MKNIFSLLFCGLMLCACGGDENPEPLTSVFLEQKPEADYAWADDKKVSLFVETFANNSRNWSVGSTSNYSFAVTNGYYSMQSKTGNNWRTWLLSLPTIDTAKDFQIEVAVKPVSGTGNSGLSWGYSDVTEHHYYFLLNFSKSINIGNYNLSSFNKWFEGEVATANISTSAYNLLTIRKVDKMYYFFANKRLIKSHVFEPFFDKYLPLQVGANSTVHIDFLTIHYLDKE